MSNPNIHKEAMFKLSYGLFVLTAEEGGKDNGCIINTCIQATEDPTTVIVAVNKAGLTHDMIVRTKRFNISMLDESAPMAVFEHFGCTKGIINSGYRSPDADIDVGGSGSGPHTLGIAADVYFYKNGQPVPSRLGFTTL